MGNSEASVNTKDCSMLSDFPGSISIDSQIINEILEGPTNPQFNNYDIFSDDDPQTNDDDIFSAVTELVDKLTNNIVKEITKENKKLTRKRSINRNNWQKNERKRAHQSVKAHVNSREKRVKPKKIKLTKDCFSNCKLKYLQKFNEIKQGKIFLDFYKLDTTGKHSFINGKSFL